MNTTKQQHSLFMTGRVFGDSWNRAGNITGLSLVSSNGKEYRIFINQVAKRLSEYIWDKVEVKFSFMDGLRDDPWIKISDFTSARKSVDNLNIQDFDSVRHDFENDRNDWRFDLDTFVDQLEEFEAA